MTDSSLTRLLVGGTALEARWIGPPPDQAPTLVLLHGGLGSAGLWNDFPERLAAATRCGVLVYSRAGYGGSDPTPLPRPLTYMHDEALDVLPAVLDAVGFRRGLLLGHSDGASIATIYAGSVQDHRIRGLILLAPHFFVEPVSVSGARAAQIEYEQGDLRTRLAVHHGPNVDVAFRGWNDAWLDPAFQAWDIQEQVGYIRVPILIVQGTEDRYGTVAQIDAARDEAYCPVEAVLLAGAGHAPFVDRADDTVAAVTDFVHQLMVTNGEAARGVTHEQ